MAPTTTETFEGLIRPVGGRWERVAVGDEREVWDTVLDRARRLPVSSDVRVTRMKAPTFFGRQTTGRN